MATAARKKTALMSGIRRNKNHKFKNPEADLLIDFLRGELLDLKERLGWTWEDLAKKLNLSGRTTAEQVFKQGGFRSMVRFARAMGVRVLVDLR